MPKLSDRLAKEMKRRGFVSLREASERLFRHPTNTRLYVRDGLLKGVANGAFYFVTEASLRKLEKLHAKKIDRPVSPRRMRTLSLIGARR